ncbi:MAG TPA: sigma-70 family RNA polymerase sigma factor [Blastocatellia bacterium]|jgi:RNA polymerase sigma factor (sigma-70 family)|nr:sigma-70 family RNA polymerase sigma factor [Blastocatellia bacterium]
MTETEIKLWERHGRRDETAQKELILFYLPLVDVLAKRVARLTGANWEDLRQEGAVGLIKAVDRFDPGRGVPFRLFARQYICGAIFDSSELTRDMSRRQDEIYRRSRRTEDALSQTLRRNPTIEEVAEKAELTIEQIRNAIDARSVAFAVALSDAEDMSASGPVEVPRPERAIFLLEALAHLNEREREIIRLYYWEGQSHQEIASELGLTENNVTKIRQRSINKLRKRLDVKPKGGQDEDRRSGK